LALLLAAPANRIFLVGDDDQSIYGWRLADVRRLLGLAESSLPGLTRVDLETNYRCPAPVLARSIRLIEHNRERFAKTIRAREDAAGSLVLAPSAADDLDRVGMVLATWRSLGLHLPADSAVTVARPTFAVLARTNRDLVPAAVAAVRLGIAFRTGELALPIESPLIDQALEEVRGVDAMPLRDIPGLMSRLARLRPEFAAESFDVVAALLGWAAGCRDIEELSARIRAFRTALGELRRDDAPLTLATAHGTKGLEFDHVAVVGLDEGRFPSARSVAEAVEPERALEEERRLAYVAWTRAKRSLTLVYDPGAPSRFLLEAFSPAELESRTPKASGARA
jgi:superfamily I DNA/RNA helicase